MAKLIQVSDDSEATWETLPGATGTFSAEAESIDDTVFGQTFQSNEIGLITWSVEANAYFKGFAGYVATVKKQGTATVAAGESFTLVSGKTYQIDDSTKEIWNRSYASFVVYDNALDKTVEVLSVDYLFGKVTFKSSYTVIGPVTVDIEYYPVVALGTANAFSLTMTADAIDITDFATAQANSGHQTSDPGLRTVQLELSGFYALASGFLAILQARSEVIIELSPDGGNLSVCRGFFLVSSEAQAGDVGALEEETTTFQLNVPTDSQVVAGGPEIPFGWQHESTSTIHKSIKICLTAWLDETKIDVQYLEDGLAGNKGQVVVTDVSLSGGLREMNEFSVSFMGDGQPTVV